MHTDVEDIGCVFAEVARVLRPGARFAYVGTHPCFVGPFVEPAPDGSRIVHAGSQEGRWQSAGPGIGRGVRSRVGVRHVPLADLLNAVLKSGLVLTEVEEIGDELPTLLALGARKP